jgi:hypothetical protein
LQVFLLFQLPVIASAAKQSISPLVEAWIASSQVLLAMTGIADSVSLCDGDAVAA